MTGPHALWTDIVLFRGSISNACITVHVHHVGNFSNCDDAMIFDFFVVFFSFVSTTAATMGNGDKQETWTHTANLKTSQAKLV
jgi:hypothetical protein